MRTRLSPRNQQKLWKELMEKSLQPERAIALAILKKTVYCWECRHYPKGGRNRGTCKLMNIMVGGHWINQPCFKKRVLANSKIRCGAMRIKESRGRDEQD